MPREIDDVPKHDTARGSAGASLYPPADSDHAGEYMAIWEWDSIQGVVASGFTF